MNEDRLATLIERLVENGQTIDWEAVRASGVTDEEMTTLRRLERVARAFGNLHTPVPAAPDDVPERFGRLQVKERLGRGSDGIVMRAYDPALERDVALKLRRSAAINTHGGASRLLREARHLARIKHPHVVAVHGADEILGWTGVWTDLLRGETLEQRLKRGVFGVDETRVVGIALCQALAAIHGDGLTHGDIKTANVMREDGGRIVLLDFGAARPAWLTELATGSISGSPLYMAPESLEGADPTPRADVYALGVTLYRLLTNAYPVEAVNIAELRAKHARGERVPLRDRRADLPAWLVSAIESALDRDPGKRVASAGMLERALEGPARAAPSRWKLAATMSGLVLAGALAAIATWSLRGTSPLTVDATLHRTADGATLGDGAIIRAGDTLHLTLRASNDVHLYVINEDSVGAVTRMFPLSRVKPDNPLAAGREWRVPAAERGRAMDWQVGPDGDVEHVLIVVTRDPLPDLDERLVGVPQALPPDTALTLRGIDRVTPAPPRTPGTALTELEHSLRDAPGDRVWMRRLTLVKRRD